MQNLYNDLMNLVQRSEAFYFVDHVIDGNIFRVFTYRLASYTEFCLPNALECRGHTFLLDGDNVELVCLPPTKFFNAFENPIVMDLDFSNVKLAMDKLDGSLISTVRDLRVPGGFRLKSKTSFTSTQAIEAEKLLQQDQLLFANITMLVNDGYCVNFEYISPTNMIVIGYEKPQLRVLNIRDMDSGETFYPHEIWETMPLLHSYLVDFTTDFNKTYEEILAMEGIEGFVLVFEDGRVCKVKTEKYCILHKTKDSVNNPKALFQACLYETSDDLRSMFHGDKVAIGLIDSMETLVRKEYNHRHHILQDFFNENKELSRKEYAIKAQKELGDMFSLCMNPYLGKDIRLKEWMMKNYRMFNIFDTTTTEE
ncbi:MAG: T4 RnlA family RNA ligase [Gammaproteobacteria bacterium]